MELRILIVDDEEIIRIGIQKKIERLLPHAAIVGLAQDASEGMELIRTLNPNIIITDIRMPEIDGLKFIEMAKAFNKSLKFVIISGYQDFEYARNAIKLGVDDYLLKPIENDQLKNILLQLEASLQSESELQLSLADLKSKARSGTDFIKNKYLTDITCHGNEFDIRHIFKNLDIVGLSFPHPLFTLVTVLISGVNQASPFSGREDLSLVRFAVRNISEELLAPAGYIASFEHTRDDKQVVVIINHKNLLDLEKNFDLTGVCSKLIYSLNKYLKLSVSIGIGRSCASPEGIPDAYTESYTAAMQKITLGDNKVIPIEDVPDCNRIDFFLQEESKLLLLNYIKQGNHKKALVIIEKIFELIKKESLSYSNIKILYIDLLLLFSRTVKESGGSWDKIFREDVFSEAYLLQFQNLDSVYACLKECISSICSYLENLSKSHSKKVIDEILEFINNYYYTEVSLNELANKYFLNPNYLSQLFKAETGENFVNYLTRIRMEKARDLLLNTELKSYKIAEMVGYSVPRYFSEVFQKYFGMTPTEFREQNK